MPATTPTNSIINLSVPDKAPEQFTDPQVRSAVELFIVSTNNLLREFERYVGATQKDVTLWSSLLASDTLIMHQSGRLYAKASENIAFGDLINLHNVAGICNIRKANAAAGLVKPARGFCSTTAGILVGAIGEVILSQGLLTISGVASGDAIYLSTSPGQGTLVAPTGAGQLEQFVGFGVANNLVQIDITQGPYLQH
jgi:hypothetical protein